MYGTRDLAHLGYRAIRFFKMKSYGAMATFGPGKKYIPALTELQWARLHQRDLFIRIALFYVYN